jgi:far upstream element-binding protein
MHPKSKSPDTLVTTACCSTQVLEEAVQPGEGEVEERVSCPSTLVGRIIGRGGETIRSLQGGSGAHILVDQNYPEGADR